MKTLYNVRDTRNGREYSEAVVSENEVRFFEKI